VEEHESRFMKGGRYYPLIVKGFVKEWLIVDFRADKNYLSSSKHVLHVVYSEDYSSAEINQVGCYPKNVKLLGDEQ
jgi:hypothetical protein